MKSPPPLAACALLTGKVLALILVLVLNPGVLDLAPLAGLPPPADDDAAADAVERITGQFSNVWLYRSKKQSPPHKVIALLGGAIRLTALALIAGVAVLAGTVASSEAQRLATQ